jgi:SAM-dependent methyltransferase
MKPGVLQKLLSYVKDVHIESLESYYNESLQVLLSKGRYQLCTPNAIYSYADKYDNFRDSFARLDLTNVDNVLILGFGMGSIPYMLEKIFNKNYTYTGVEIDASIIFLASKYVLDELKSEVSIVEADAWSYICQSSTKYDLVCIDIFVDDKIPDVFLTEEFLENVKENLSTKGILLFNHLAFHKKDIIAANQYFNDVFINAFPNGQIIALKTNYVMLNDKSMLRNL